MHEAFDREQLRSLTRRWRGEGRRTALVPTMGNLHAGHLALVDAARQQADRVITSIYVNPAQFGAGEDFESYPRTLDSDREALRQAGCDLMFAPEHRAMYPGGLDDSVRLLASPDLTPLLEGEFRPGHFDGVVTVVARLFNLVGPDVAVFGEKDYQQLLVIRRLVRDLGFDIRIEAVPTVREDSGLALSSRNSYLDTAQKSAAAEMNRALVHAARRVGKGVTDFEALEQEVAGRLQRHGMRVEYVAVRRADNLQLPSRNDRELRILAAAWCGQTRLIDNIESLIVGF